MRQIALFFLLFLFSATLAEAEILCMSGAKKMTLAGAKIRNGSQWLVLECSKTSCRLAERKLKVKNVMVPGYDSEEEGQEIEVLSSKIPVAVLRNIKGLKVGRVVTYYNPLSGPPKKRSGKGDMELQVENGNEIYDIVPMKKKESVSFYLKHRSKWQMIKNLAVNDMAGFSGIPRDESLLLWAGDLDADGIADFLMSLDGRTGESVQLTLLLSSFAKKEDLVGVAASCYYWPPDDPGC